MSFNFSKSKFVSVCTTCDKYAWLDKYRPDDKKPIDEYTESLFANGHKVGELAKKYFNIDVDVTILNEFDEPMMPSALPLLHSMTFHLLWNFQQHFPALSNGDLPL